MKDAGQIAEFLLSRIDQIYERPLMYGGTSEGVDIVLHYYHELWAMIFGREEEYQAISGTLHSEAGGVSASFTFNYRRSRPHASDEETVRYVVEQWARISKGLEMPVSRVGKRPD